MEAQIQSLEQNALQIVGSSATYTGLPDIDMSLGGNLLMNNSSITNINELTANSLSVKNVDDDNYYTITGNLAGLQVGANIITPDNITCNTLNYTALNPPISGGSQNIEQVLITGSNANGQSLSGLTL